MKFIIIISFILLITINSISLVDLKEKLEQLENLIIQYKEQTKNKYSKEQLLLSYLREIRYTGFEWTLAAGDVPKDLNEFISKNNKNISDLRNEIKTDFYITNETKIDFVHLCAVMNGIIFSGDNNSDKSQLVGWAGDLEQLFEEIKTKNGDLKNLINEAKNAIGNSNSFGKEDLMADLDAPILVKKMKDNKNETFGSIIFNYYNNSINENERVDNFIKITFPSLINEKNETDKNIYRDFIFKEYTRNIFIPRLECQSGFRNSFLSCKFIPGCLKKKYKDHQKAVTYGFADYLANKTSFKHVPKNK